MLKTLIKVGIEGTYLNIIKAIYDKPTANIILNSVKLKAFPLNSGTGHGCLLLHFCLHSVRSPNHNNHTRKRKVKLSLSADNMIIYIENYKVSTPKTITTNK